MATKTTDQATRDAIHRALPGRKGNEWSTAVAVADAVGKAYSTITENLRAMAVDGWVESRKLGRSTVWRKLRPSPRLKKDDVPTPLAHTVSPEPPGDDAAKGGRSRKPRAAGQEAAEAPEPSAVPQAPPAADTPAGDGVGAVLGFMEAVRPVSAAPAESVRKARRPKAEAKTYAVFGRGQLQAAILNHVQALPEGTDATPYQVAAALNAYPGAVAYGLGRLEVKGNVVKTSDQPQRYAAV